MGLRKRIEDIEFSLFKQNTENAKMYEMIDKVQTGLLSKIDRAIMINKSDIENIKIKIDQLECSHPADKRVLIDSSDEYGDMYEDAYYIEKCSKCGKHLSDESSNIDPKEWQKEQNKRLYEMHKSEAERYKKLYENDGC